MSQIASGTHRSRASVIRFGRFTSSRLRPHCRDIAGTAGPSGISGTIRDADAALSGRRAGAREPPHRRALRGALRIAPDEIQLRLCEARLELVDTAEIIELDRRLLQRQSDEVNGPYRRQRRKALAHPHPIFEPGDRQHGGKPPLLIVARKRTFLPAALDVSGDLGRSAAEQLLRTLAGVS